jgi:hypothetical protein
MTKEAVPDGSDRRRDSEGDSFHDGVQRPAPGRMIVLTMSDFLSRSRFGAYTC